MSLHLKPALDHLLRCRSELRTARHLAKTDEEKRVLFDLVQRLNEPTDELRRLTTETKGD